MAVGARVLGSKWKGEAGCGHSALCLDPDFSAGVRHTSE